MTVLALYTTIYPGVERFLSDWYESVLRQTDRDVQLWIGLDGLKIEVAQKALGGRPRVTWVPAEVGDTPAQVRQRALARIADSCDGVVLVDSDDVLHPTRVAAARESLLDGDVTGCALRLVDGQGCDLGMVLGLPCGSQPADVLPRHNIYGLSNSAYRSDILRRCLPIPADAVLVDWFLATRAWLYGALLTFDPAVRMDYRQHDANTARTQLPFAPGQIHSDTLLVRRHFEILKSSPTPGASSERLALVERVAADVDAFHRQVVLQPKRLEFYVRALNALAPVPLWWSSVAHPALQHLWTAQKEPA